MTAMLAPDSRGWLKIAVFYGLTVLFSAVFWLLDHLARVQFNPLLMTGLMWCPGLAALVCCRLWGQPLESLGFGWPANRYAQLGFWLPVGVTTCVYVVTWVSGLGGFFDHRFLQSVAADYGLLALPAPVALVAYALLMLTANMVLAIARALGEELGWRGFLVPALSKVTGTAAVSLITGGMWALWHVPVILFSAYHSSTPPWYNILCFTVLIVSCAFVMTRLRLRSGSVWPSVLFHAAHNVVVQRICTPLTIDTGKTAWIIDEFGAGLAVAWLIGATVMLCWKRDGSSPTDTLAQVCRRLA
jgi:uncharacterized protein